VNAPRRRRPCRRKRGRSRHPLLLAEAYRQRIQVSAQESLLRDLFNPFDAVTVEPSRQAWHGGAVPKLAQAVYEERQLPSGHLDCARLAILADMLEEAGCADPQLLGHLRGTGPHGRGCFAVDLSTPVDRGAYANQGE
jgi:hypothetical protein